MRDFDQLLAAFLVQLGDPQAKQLALGRRSQSEIGIDDRPLDGGDHGLVPDLNREQPRLRHADRRKLIERHVGAIGFDLHRLEQARRCAAGPQAPELLFEDVNRALHAPLDVGEVVCRGCHDCLSH